MPGALRRTHLLASILALLTLPSIGCLGEPIPKRVVAGTTFTFPFNVGVFGVDPSTNPETLMSSDPQRGNVRFTLCTTASCTTQRSLSTRYITRMFPDPGSRLGLAGATEVRSSGTLQVSPGGILGEPLVIADVPPGTPAGTYMLSAFVDPPGPAGETMTVLEPIEIVPGTTSSFTNLSRLVNLFDADGSDSFKGFIPYPQLLLQLADTQNLADRPAAGTIVVRHPSSVRIEGAFETGVLGQGSVVRLTAGPDSTVSVLFVDPDRRIPSISLAFTLLGSSPTAVSLDGFTVVSQALYTSSGSSLPITATVAEPGNSFKVADIR